MRSQSISLPGRAGRPFDYDPPDVRWVESGSSAWPEPPCDPKASHLESLRYQAALVKARCGVDCRIGQLNSPNTFDFVVYSPAAAFTRSGNCGDYWTSREFLHGIEAGAIATKWPAE